ncbi:hypothetical protein HOL63_01930 [Candidatus Peregrinibacteria bacterium]|jgi:hypothetical protein|nr:hypothetical protein [Candidatus Peregrinibacteria bacterium]MBT5468832.1 hypothetical protein [Candidatus Peregrinibacteria bacterium]MBT7337601.1 hypothetical protein [Candidatus Peregrinibacteria bacterium]
MQPFFSMRYRSLIAVSSLFLVACSGGSIDIQPLPPEDVLAKAAKATQSLESTKYILTGNVKARSSDFWSVSGSVRVDGVLRGAGKQMRFQMDTDADVTTAEGQFNVDGTLEVIVASEDEVYMNLHSLTTQPPNPILRPDLVGKLASKWWLLPQGDALPVTGQVTPDPRLLHAQSQVVRIVKDNGIKNMNGASVYHYNVELDKEKLVAYMKQAAEGSAEFDAAAIKESLEDVIATGQLWVDASTYFVHKLQWDIEGYPLQNGGNLTAKFTVDFSDHNSAPEIIPPADAKVFSPYELLSFPNDTIGDDELFEGDSSLDDDTINSILRSMDSY